jgi:2,5-diketo-D-gluconate reductase B
MKKYSGPIPQMGFGTWKRAGEDGAEAVLAALQAGYRHIDTASAYGNEEDVGLALQKSGLARNDVFITTKVWPSDYGPGGVLKSIRGSLQKLQLHKVDLLHLHWPSRDHDMTDAIKQLADAQDQGLTKLIGVSNFNRTLLDLAVKILGAKRIATLQIEIHPLCQNKSMVAYAHDRGIACTAYTPLARGAILTNPTIQALAKKRKATEGQVSLAFLMAEGHIVIPTSSSPKRMAENFAAKDVILTSDDINVMREIDEDRRLVTGSWDPDWSA